MSSETTSRCEETERAQRLIIMRQTIEEYINGNPETSAFRFFLPSTQGLDEVKQAAAKVSLSTGKCIDLIYPTGITGREGYMSNYINDVNSAGEWARLDHQARLVGKTTGLLPALFDDMEFTNILDVGCGPGHWALDIAINRPETLVTGIDVSRDLVDYANARARTQQLDNISFGVQDFLTHELPFSEGSFDLIHVRFAVGWVKGYANWLLLLARCYTLLKPGGWIILTEGEGIYTTSSALERLQGILCQAFFTTEYSLSHSPRFMGVVARLGSLLCQTGFQKIQTDTTVLDYSYYSEEANRAWRESFHALINESALFLLKSNATTAEELAQLDTQISIDMFQQDFCGIGPLFTFSAQKPVEKLLTPLSERAESSFH